MAKMRHFTPSLTLAAAVAAGAALHLPAAGLAPAMAAEAALHTPPAHIQAIAGSPLKRITLTDKAAKRLDIQTGEVRQDPAGGSVVPYAAVLYDIAGVAWVYTNPEPLTFVRHRVEVARINGADAYLKDGPPVGTRVVKVGVAQLYGAEKGIGH
jgi:hypothetical protein